VSELEAYIEAVIEQKRQRGDFWCGLCGLDHLDETSECPVPIKPKLVGMNEFLADGK
jgi:hypothetical protein